MKKQCTRCNKIKDINLFYRNKNKNDGRQNACKVCANIMTKIWRFGKGKKKYSKYKKSPDSYKKHLKYNRERTQIQRDILDLKYVKKLMVQKSPTLKIEDISDDLAKAYALNLKLKRLLKKT